MKHNIILMHYNRWDLTHARLWEIYKHLRTHDISVILVNNGSDDDQTDGGIRWWLDQSIIMDLDIHVVSIENSIGFLLGVNAGLGYYLDFPDFGVEEHNSTITVISNDVLISGDFLAQVEEIMTSTPNALIGGVVYLQDTGWNTHNGEVFPYLEGWLLSTSIDNWRALGGGFDELFAPNDYEDIDLSTTAIRNCDMELVALNSPYLHHLSAQTLKYGNARLEITKKNMEKFKQKWIK